AVFMLIFGVNFNIYFLLLVRKLKSAFRNAELRVYLLIAGAATALIAVNTYHLFSNVEECLRTSFFQVTTIMSTTGFATTNYDLFWPDLSKTILVVLMIIGGCAGSTAGGLKVSRVMLVIKNMAREVKRIVRPRSVNVVKQDGEAVPLDTLHHVSNYITIYVFIIIITTLLLSIDGHGLETNLTATLACVNNIGPGLAKVGPAENFAFYSYFSKLLLTMDMLIGRLEILPMLIFFSPAVWNLRGLRKRKEENVDVLQ
ncbi:MAG: TrkH family potassium uptake protein, partial [Oscillospiraceae bacterium]|nr:TrkH family potassium uptake protein [Oscillospiraceae bacterium]